MSNELMNIIKILCVAFVLLFVWNQAVGDIKGWDSKYSQKEVKEQIDQETVEEEPDCE